MIIQRLVAKILVAQMGVVAMIAILEIAVIVVVVMDVARNQITVALSKQITVKIGTFKFIEPFFILKVSFQ